MKKTFKTLALALAILFSCAACGNPTVSVKGEDVILDYKMENGVGVLGKVSISDLGNITYDFDYMGSVPENTVSFWRLGQWGTKFGLADTGEQSQDGDKYILRDQTKEFIVNPKTGEYSLNCDTREEYPTPLKAGEDWLHLITIQNLADISPVSDMKNIYMDFDFTIDECENYMTSSEFNTDIHTALFQWVFVVKNMNPDSLDYNQYFWLNFPFYDGRSLTHDGYDTFAERAFLDYGKEDKSNSFIYMADSNDYFPEGGVSLGERTHVTVDILPFIEKALAKIQSLPENSGSDYPLLTRTELSDLVIGQFYMGWETPGTFKSNATIHSNHLYYNKA